MRFAKFFLMLGVLLIFGSNAKADEIRVTAYAVFQQPNAESSNQQFIFSSTFLYELDTNELVAGSISTHVTDTIGGTPYTNWVPKPNFHGPSFTYFDPDLDEVQLLFALPGAPVVFPAVGWYPVTDIALTCVTFACAEHFGPDVPVPVAGELSVRAVPEPETGILLVFSVLVAPLFVAKAKPFRPLRC
jgi:hypothetical protein